MTSCQNQTSQRLLRRFAEVTAMGLPVQMRMVQCDRDAGTYTAVLEKDDTISSAILRLVITIRRVEVYEPGVEEQ